MSVRSDTLLEDLRATQRVEVKPSLLVPSEKITTYIYICPSCGRDLPNARHAHDTYCTHCKLHIMVMGAGMYVSRSRITFNPN